MITAIIQARMGSTRLPGKVLKTIHGKSIIEIILNRVSESKKINQIILATSNNPENNSLVKKVKELGYCCEIGSENDVLDRYYQTALKYKSDVIVRITGDCPLIDVDIIDECIHKYFETGSDYCSNTFPPTYPDGLDTEVFSFAALEEAAKNATSSYDREHVTPFIRNVHHFKKTNITTTPDYSNYRWTLDEAADFEVINNIFVQLGTDKYFPWHKVLELQAKHPEYFMANKKLNRNEGMIMNTGQKLWNRAKQVIPGGNMLLSKRPEMFLPDLWPSYFSKAKGCTVWDLDGRPYTDMSIMGIGTNSLGYGHSEVDEAVHKTVEYGNMSTLNCPEEVYLAEKLIELHPWADMARLARTGGEANAIAIRIARAATGKDNIAICGYHGWHDWYLSANLENDGNLGGHLLPGLEPNGVPLNLKGTTHPFNYNDFDTLEKLVCTKNIGVIKMEVFRNIEPENNFLHKVRELATRKGIVLIFDECTSGFRETFGGLHKKYNIEPDMALFGKALGNGYAITAIIGRREVMEAAQTSFISSTFWTERIGPSAALKTLEVMEREQSWLKITNTGSNIKSGWQALADKYNLEISHWGLPALAGFTFLSDNALMYKTLISQEMLTKGFLAGTSVYACTEHTPSLVNNYFEELDPIFALIKECEEGRSVNDLIKSTVCHSGFKRLN